MADFVIGVGVKRILAELLLLRYTNNDTRKRAIDLKSICGVGRETSG